MTELYLGSALAIPVAWSAQRTDRRQPIEPPTKSKSRKI
jgi:hypothetical protein